MPAKNYTAFHFQKSICQNRIFVLPIFFSLFLLLSCENKKSTTSHLGADTSTESTKTDVVVSAKYRFLSPEINGIIYSTEATKIKSFDAELNGVITKLKTNGLLKDISICVYQPSSSFKLLINQSEKYHAASLMKLPIMMAFLKKAIDSPNIQNRLITFRPINLGAPNNIPIQMTIGNKYTAADMLQRSIVYSDNDANALLQINFLDHQYQGKFYKDFGMQGQEDYPNTDNMDVVNYMKFLTSLYNAKYLDKDKSDYALRLLSQSYFVEGMVKGMPANITVSHKYGEWKTAEGYQFHDFGIVYLNQRTYFLGVMTKGHDMASLTQAMQTISAFIYQKMTAQQPL
ncbi:MAG: serine hydrolase [Bacteroidetes bacterium]|nr:serine hydrolase [Bacteroidota bacterium]